jgi:competence protein ComGC
MGKHTPILQGSERGYTLVEILVASTLAIIVLMPVYTIFATSHTTYNTGVDRADIQQNARVALYRMSRDARMAGYESPGLVIPACPRPKTAACVLPTQQASRMGIRADVDADDITEEVEYDLQNCVNQICDLARREREWDSATSSWGPWSTYEIIANKVSSLTFSYLPAANPTTLRIQVDLQDTSTGPNVDFMVVSDMELRNL